VTASSKNDQKLFVQINQTCFKTGIIPIHIWNGETQTTQVKLESILSILNAS
jgi:hypothetical protein